MARRIAVVTTSRADYGLLSWLLKALRADRRFELKLIACGSHLSKRFGYTVKEIEQDGFNLSARVPTDSGDGDPAAIAKGIGRGLSDFAAVYRKLKPELLVVLGDRQELLAAVPAAVLMKIPIAHIHGGESTEGVLDEQVRHAVTKMSHLHFPTAELYRRRLIRMGEDPRHVWCFGAPGLESIRLLEPIGPAKLEEEIGLPIDRKTILVTYHPDGTSSGAQRLCDALDKLGLSAIFTAANADSGGNGINSAIERYCSRRRGRVTFVPSLGHRKYLSVARLCGAVAGNSSSGIIEVPSLGVPTVNIGDRQKGRLRSPSVVDCPADTGAIVRSLRRALSPDFRSRCRGKNAYGDGHFAARAATVLAKVPLGDTLLRSKTVRGLDRVR